MGEKGWKWAGGASTAIGLAGIVTGLWHIFGRFPLYSKIMVGVGLVGLAVVAWHHRKLVVEWLKGTTKSDGDIYAITAPSNLAAIGGGKIDAQGNLNLITGGDLSSLASMFPSAASWADPPTVSILWTLKTKLSELSSEVWNLNSTPAEERVQIYGEHCASRVLAVYGEAQARGSADLYLQMILLQGNAGQSPVIAQHLGALAESIDPEAQGLSDEG